MKKRIARDMFRAAQTLERFDYFRKWSGKSPNLNHAENLEDTVKELVENILMALPKE